MGQEVEVILSIKHLTDYGLRIIPYTGLNLVK